MNLKNATLALCFSLCATATQAQVAVVASHRVIDVFTDSTSTQVTIDITLRNTGEALESMTMTSLEPYFTEGQIVTVDIGSLAEGETRVVRWVTRSLFAPEFFVDPHMLAFHGSASAASGVQAFPVVSDEEAQ